MKRFFLIYALFFTQFCAWSQTVIVADSVSRPARINRQNLFIKPNGSLFAMPRIGAPYALGLSPAERLKLDGIEAGANNYTHPTTHPASVIVQDAGNRFFTDTERSKLGGIEAGANNYTHPSTHPASVIVQDAGNRFFTDTERSKLGGIEAGANNYTHPSTHPASVIVQDAGNRFASDSEKSSWNGLPKGLIATTYANALTLCAALPTGVAALVKITADESSGNAGTGEAGANPTTYYLYFPTTGLIQQVIYPQ